MNVRDAVRGTLQDADGPRQSLFREKEGRSNREREADFRPAGFATYDQPFKREFRGERKEGEKKIGKTDVHGQEEEEAGRKARVSVLPALLRRAQWGERKEENARHHPGR